MKIGILRVTDLLMQSEPGRHAETRLRGFVEQVQQDLKKAGADAARKQQQAQQETEHLRQLLVDEVMDAIGPLVKTTAEQMQLSLILSAPNPSLIYFTQEVDITEAVLKQVNAQAAPIKSRIDETFNRRTAKAR